MTITVQDLLTTLGNRAWSGFNKDDMVFGEEEAQTALAELNTAHRYLMSLRGFPFKQHIEDLTAIKNISEYSMVEGQIKEIVDTSTLTSLTQVGDIASLESAKGQPTKYYVDYSNPDANIVLYPTPDKKYSYKVVYNTFKFILNKDGEEIYEFQNADDYLNMPSYLENLYAECLVLRTMAQNNKDEQDENYAPILNEFAETWRNFIRLAKPAKQESRVIF